jgi:hypothetical protein
MNSCLKCLAVAAVIAGSSFAAKADGTLSELKGKVLVNTGAGFVNASEQTLKPGSRIMVSPGASARISFPDGCSVPLKPGLLTIGAKSPCTSKAQVLSGPALAALFGAAALISVAIGVTTSNQGSFTSP